jgi:hypothetical protein
MVGLYASTTGLDPTLNGLSLSSTDRQQRLVCTLMLIVEEDGHRMVGLISKAIVEMSDFDGDVPSCDTPHLFQLTQRPEK